MTSYRISPPPLARLLAAPYLLWKVTTAGWLGGTL